MASAMLRLADDKPRAGASLDDVRFDAKAFFPEAASPSALRGIVESSVIPRLCLALKSQSLAADRSAPGKPARGARFHDRASAHLASLQVASLQVASPQLASPQLASPQLADFRLPTSPLDLASPHELPCPQDQTNIHDHVGALVDCLFANEVDSACARLDAIRARGSSLERLFLELLMPAAVQLNQLLADDLQDCAAVTIAFLNLHAVLRRFAVDFREEGGCADNGSRALLASPLASSGNAGLQTFGLLFMAEFFRRDGWDALTERSLRSASFRDTIEREWFDIVEVLANRDEDLDEIASGIRLIRRGARNPDVGIIACGRIFSERPEIIGLVGADRSASDLPAGLSSARAFVSRLSERQLLS